MLIKATIIALLLWFPQLSTADSTPPNFIVIVADDLGYGDLSSFGATHISTPHIDQLGASGLRFTQFYAAASVCTPSRAGLLTGRQASRMGMEHVFMHDSHDGLPLSEITIAEQLKQADYSTALVGKWHLGHLDRYMPWNQGFDEFYGVAFSNDMPNLFFYENQEILYEEIDQRFLTQRYTKRALDFIERNARQPFFLYLAHSMPHVPVYASPKFEGTSRAGIYGDAVQELDWSTGKIVDHLAKLRILDNTVIVFTSDNGPWRAMGSHAGSAGPLRDGKGSAFEGGQRVPTVMHWPSGIVQAREVNHIASLLDLMPTFSALAGVPLPKGVAIDGRDISPLITSGSTETPEEFFYQGFFTYELAAYREGNWKLKLPRTGYPRFIEPILKLDAYGHGLMLFNLDEDPGEQKNLADQYPERVEQMRQVLHTKQAELDTDRERILYMRPLAADRQGYGGLIARAATSALVALIVLIVILRWVYRRIRSRGKIDASGTNPNDRG